MSKYVIQYYAKTSSISKDKELISLLEKLNSVDENDKKSLKEILVKALKNVIQKESGLYKHSKTQLLKYLFNKESSTEMINYIKQLEDKFLKGEITHIEFVDKVFKKAKEDKTYISRTHFLMYLKKVQEQKLISFLESDPYKFLKDIKENNIGKEINNFFNDWINGPVLNDWKKDSFLTIRREIFNKIHYENKNKIFDIFNNVIEPSSLSVIERLLSKTLKQSFFKKSRNTKEYINLKQFLFKVINSEPITNEDIEKWTKLDTVIKNMQKEGVNFYDIEKFKKSFFIFFRKEILAELRKSFFDRLHFNKEKAKTIENAILVMPYYKKLREISYHFNGLDKNSIEDIIYLSFNEKHEMQFFNFSPDSIDEILNHIQIAKQFIKEKEIEKALEGFEKVLFNIKDKNEVTKNDLLLVKEVYEELKEKLFLYRKSSFISSIDPLFETFTNIRNVYKKTFFKSTKEMFDIYKQSKIAEIKIKIDNFLPNSNSLYLKFNPNSRMFECYDEKDNSLKFSLPVSAVMNKERTAIKKNVSIKSIISIDKRKKLIDKKEIENISVINYDEVNKTLQRNIYNFKQNLFKEKDLKKSENDSPKI